MTSRIFYSWQSDLPNRTNRGFIEQALEKAVRVLRTDETLGVEPVVDRDTAGVPGTPDIAQTIFAKIVASEVFVGDVSIVQHPPGGRPVPNPNVLIELGFALRALGSERIIMVCNEAFGAVTALPFDLHLKRAVTYTLPQDVPERSTVQQDLARKLHAALTHIFAYIEAASRARLSNAFLAQLHPLLVDLLIATAEEEERAKQGWQIDPYGLYEASKRQLRVLAASAEATALGVAESLHTLAERLASMVSHVRVSGPEGWRSYLAKVQAAETLAREIKTRWLAPAATGQMLLGAPPSEVIATVGRQLQSLANRCVQLQQEPQFQDIVEMQRDASELGGQLLRLSQVGPDSITTELAAWLQHVGRPLHLLDTVQIMGDGERAVESILAEVRTQATLFQRAIAPRL